MVLPLGGQGDGCCTKGGKRRGEPEQEGVSKQLLDLEAQRKVLEMDLYVRAHPGWLQQLREVARSSKTSVR